MEPSLLASRHIPEPEDLVVITPRGQHASFGTVHHLENSASVAAECADRHAAFRVPDAHSTIGFTRREVPAVRAVGYDT